MKRLTVMKGAPVRAIEGVYRRRLAQFVRIAAGITGDGETARDVVQEAFARAIINRGSFRGDGDLEAWIARIVVNISRDTVRCRRASAHATSEDIVDSAELGAPDDQLRTAIAMLPERQRLALFLRYYADFDYQQIADVLCVRRGTVSATLHGAHASIARLFQEVPS